MRGSGKSTRVFLGLKRQQVLLNGLQLCSSEYAFCEVERKAKRRGLTLVSRSTERIGVLHASQAQWGLIM